MSIPINKKLRIKKITKFRNTQLLDSPYYIFFGFFHSLHQLVFTRFLMGSGKKSVNPNDVANTYSITIYSSPGLLVTEINHD